MYIIYAFMCHILCRVLLTVQEGRRAIPRLLASDCLQFRLDARGNPGWGENNLKMGVGVDDVVI